jgi:hypothetical protein
MTDMVTIKTFFDKRRDLVIITFPNGSEIRMTIGEYEERMRGLDEG